MKGSVRLVASIALLLAAAILSGTALAQEPNQAGLVFVFEDGRVEALCVSFAEAQVSGADLLALSGVEIALDTASSMGVTLCGVEGEGCDFPAEPCFCQCMGGGECLYWNYFYRDPGEETWTYSALGAAMRQVSPGSVEAWVWGDGQTPPGEDLTFAAICAPATPTPTATLSPAPTEAPVTAAPTATEPPLETPSPGPTAAPVLTPTPAPTASASRAEAGSTLSSYWLFGLMILALVAVGVFVWRRRT